MVFSDALNHASIIDGCRLSRAETFVYDHCDIDHLEWGLRQAEGRGALIVTDGVFSMDGDVAPLAEIVELAQRYDARVMVDEAHGIGASAPAGAARSPPPGSRTRSTWSSARSARRSAPTAPTSCCDKPMAKYLINTARTLIFSTALPPPAVAAAMAALELLREQPRRVEKLQRNARGAARGADRAGACRRAGSRRQIVPLVVGDADAAMRACERALERGVFAQAIRPPTVPAGTSRLRLAVMASHTKSELRDAAGVLARGGAPGRAAPGRGAPRHREPPRRVFDGVAEPRKRRVARARDLRNRHGHGRRQVGGGGRHLRRALARGEQGAAFKPVVTGLDERAGDWPRDHELLAGRGRRAGARGGVAVRFGPAVSPHLPPSWRASRSSRAARRGGGAAEGRRARRARASAA